MKTEIENEALNAHLDSSLFHSETIREFATHPFKGGLPFSGDELARVKIAISGKAGE